MPAASHHLNRVSRDHSSSQSRGPRSRRLLAPASLFRDLLLQIAVLQLLLLHFSGPLRAQQSEGSLIREIAAKASEAEAARAHYTYRQSVVFQELDSHGAEVGGYREVRDIIFSPDAKRSEILVGAPELYLKRLKLTEEDFRDIREVNPFVFTREQLLYYQTKFQGEEPVSGSNCRVLRISPRQILDGQRLFEGLVWVSEKDRQIVRAEGKPVPQIYRKSGENLFPRFTTIYQPVDGHWFPVRTLADDTLQFRGGPQRVRITIRYDDYKRFTSESTIEFQQKQ